MLLLSADFRQVKGRDLLHGMSDHGYHALATHAPKGGTQPHSQGIETARDIHQIQGEKVGKQKTKIVKEGKIAG